MRLEATATVLPLTDVDLLRRVVPHLLTAVRAVPVVDGAPVDAWGRRCTGVQVTGVHPRPGTRYAVTVPPAPTRAEAAATEIPVEAERELLGLRRRGDLAAVDAWYRRWLPARAATGGTPVVVELRADTRAEVAVVVHLDGVQVEVELADPGSARAVVVRASGVVAAGHRFVDGPVDGEAEVQLDRLPPRQDRRPQVTASGSFRRGAGSLRLWVEPEGDHWRARATVRLTGRGVLRPVVFLGGLFGRGRLKRMVTEELAKAGTVRGLSDLRAVFGPDPDPAEIAAVLVERVLVLARPDR